MSQSQRRSVAAWAAAWWLACACAASSAGAQSKAPVLAPRTGAAYTLPALHPNLIRGARPEGRYESDEVAAVDLFNGNLRLSVPLGQIYPVDSQLSYLFQLHYNSQVWDFSSGSGSSGPGWVHGNPLAHSNSGLGFDLSFGRLLPPATAGNPTSQWLYVSPDGGPHSFYSALHHDTPDPSDPGDLAQYTRDGSYLRLRQVGSERRVEQGNGVARVFVQYREQWRLSRLESLAGSSLSVAYASDGSSWTFTDSHGRTATVSFVADPTGRYPRLVGNVDLPAFGGGRALYTFAYTQATVARSCSDTRGGSETVPLLASITDPVGRVHGFEHYGAGADCHDAGRLKRHRLLSGGFHEWDYAGYAFPPTSCSASPPAYLVNGSGVVSKSKLQPSGAVVGTWTYAPQVTAAASGCGHDARRTVVTTPLGDQTVHHFAVGTDAPSAGGPALYGLPIAPTRPDASGQLFLSEEVFDCAPAADCALVRSRWQRFEQDQLCASTGGNCFHTNRRLQSSLEVFEDDEPVQGVKRFRGYAWSSFDGLGHYRVRAQASNFGRADAFTSEQHTNSAAGTYPPGAFTGNVFVVPAPSEPWFLQDYTYTQASDENGQSVRADACFSAQGLLLRTRRRAEAAQLTARDLVTAAAWEGGERTVETRYGGDTQALDTTSDLCVVALPAAGFTTEWDFAHGALARERRFDLDGTPLGYLTVDRDIDAATGKVAEERDSTGLATAYLFDLAGRPTWERREEGAWTEYVYTAPNGGSGWNSGPKTTILERPNGGSGTALSTRHVFRDALGRATGRWSSMPGGVTSGVRTQYNALDWRTHESTAYQVGNPTLSWTQYLDHDPFGRARTLRPPEGAAHDEVLVFKGEREEVRTSQVGRYFDPFSHLCYEHPATVTKTFDGQGRLWSELRNQPHPLPGQTQWTELAYGPDGQLVSRRDETTIASTTTGERSDWVYDGRGLLLEQSSESLSGQIGEASLYTEHDARGLPGRESQSGTFLPASGVAARRSYDALGRVVLVADAAEPTKKWKELEYGSENLTTTSGTDRRLGQLVRATRHNYFEGAHHTVTEEYRYLGVGGRPSEKTFSVATVSSPNVELQLNKSYRTTISYDDLGDPRRLDYPACLTCAPGETAVAGTVLPSYDQGRLVALGGERAGVAEGWLATVTWSVNGRPFDVTHGNGVREHYQPDSFGKPREASIAVIPPVGASHGSGSIVYDGAGWECGRGDESAVREVLEPGPDPEVSGPCVRSAAVDPFGGWSGEVLDPTCRGNELSNYRLYDAFDRHVATLQRSALRLVLVNGVPYWQPDPTRFVRQWTLFGLDPQPLSKVEEHVSQGFNNRRDSVYALGRLVGRTWQPYAGSSVVRAHKHPLGARNTRPDGYPWNTEF